MLNRMLLAGMATLLVGLTSPVQSVQARGNHYERGCDNCGRVVRIESIGQRDHRVGGGTVLGAIIGGALGNQVGKGDGRKAATVAGALAGGAIGHNIEKDNRRTRSYYRILVRMDRGRTYSFEQPDRYRLGRGDRVYIDNGYVVPAN
jgi:outer membrane lipoprotein SlyB